jgi:nicotinate-nucleotide pyrophosphorylase (carboxylating)
MTNLERLIIVALDEDLIDGRDATSEAFVDPDMQGTGWIEARADGVVSGLDVVAAVFRQVDPGIQLDRVRVDGDYVHRLDRIIEIEGRASSILKAERTALNFLCHLSGVATRTNEFVRLTRQWGTKILCTRKTLPGLRELEIAAVRHGGGDAYRTNLSDAVLVKDNHLAMLGGMQELRSRLDEIRSRDPGAFEILMREGKVEADSLADVEAAVDMGWRQILLDNFLPADVTLAVRRWGRAVYLEVSGGVHLGNVADYAATGVHAISIGAVTHSSKAIDFSLEVEWRHE